MSGALEMIILLWLVIGFLTAAVESSYTAYPETLCRYLLVVLKVTVLWPWYLGQLTVYLLSGKYNFERRM